LSLRDAAQRDADHEAAHGSLIPFMLSGLGFVAGVVALAIYLAMRYFICGSRAGCLDLELPFFLGYFGPNLARLGLRSANVTMAVHFLPALIVQAALPILLIRDPFRGNRDARVVLPAIAVVSVANYWNFLSNAGVILHLPFRIPPLPNAHIGTHKMNLWDTLIPSVRTRSIRWDGRSGLPP
jgi:hypothetical protein